MWFSAVRAFILLAVEFGARPHFLAVVARSQMNHSFSERCAFDADVYSSHVQKLPGLALLAS